MQVAVTGGAGFLGSHVADVLAEAGHDVRVIDLKPSARHPFNIADLGDPRQLERALAGSDAVCHLAAVGDIYVAEREPALAAHVNATGTANLCEAALQAGVSEIIYASTWEVYGTARYEPIDEEHPTAPVHPYAITKLAGERLALAYGAMRSGLRVATLRLGTAYGTRMRPNSVFSIFIDRSARHEPIVLQGGGRQSRQFTHARDIGRAFALALGRAEGGRVYNIVSAESVTIRQLADEIVRRLPTSIEDGPARSHDVPFALVSSARARTELGWSAEIRFSEGIDAMIQESLAIPRGRRGRGGAAAETR